MIEVIHGNTPLPDSPLQGIIEERVAPGAAATAPPADAELLILVLEGTLTCTDDRHGDLHIPAGCLYHQSAGVGALSNLRNSADSQFLHLLHCLLLPGIRIRPRQAQQILPDIRGRLRLIASPAGEPDRVHIDAPVSLYLAALVAGDAPVHSLDRGHRALVHLAAGHAFVCGMELKGGEAALVRDDSLVAIYADADSLLLLFDMPAAR